MLFIDGNGTDGPTDFIIREGAVYTYVADYPPACRGHWYRVLKPSIPHWPVGTHVVLVEALTGPDKGAWFTTTLGNFASRYEPVPVDQLPDARAG